jgi:lambda family phage portal protein
MKKKPLTIVQKVLAKFGFEKRSNATVYSGASGTRLTLDWIATILSADQEIRGNLRLLRARGRELSRNNPIAKNFLNLLAANVAGPNGIGYKAQVRNATAVCPKCAGTGKVVDDGGKPVAGAGSCKNCKGAGQLKNVLARAINDKIEAGFKDWGKKGNCTVDGRLSWRQVQDLAIKNVATDGEVFIRKIKNFPNKYRFAVQIIDSDQCDHLYSVPPSPKTNEIRLGVEIDKWARPLAYWLNPGHPSDLGGSLQRERVPADEIIHLYDPERVSQTRGVTWFHPVMLQLRMLEGYIEAELVAARTGAAKMGWLEHTDAGAYEEPDPDHKYVLEANPGTIETLPPGMKFTEWSPDHPPSAFPMFVITILRQIATGLGVSYNALASDLVGVNYSSMRSGLLIERDQWKRGQSWLTESLCQPVFEDWLTFALLTGELVLDSRDPAKFAAGKWEPRGWQWVDPLKDAQSAILAIGARLRSRDAIVAETGEDIGEVFEAIQQEEQLAEELGLDLTLPGATKPLGGPADQSEEDDEGSPGGTDGTTGGADDDDDAASEKNAIALLRVLLKPSRRGKAGPTLQPTRLTQ